MRIAIAFIVAACMVMPATAQRKFVASPLEIVSEAEAPERATLDQVPTQAVVNVERVIRPKRPVVKDEVIVASVTEGCPPCEAFKAIEPKITDTNWTVEYAQATGAAPSFVMWIDGKPSARKVGYHGEADFYEWMGEAMASLTGNDNAAGLRVQVRRSTPVVSTTPSNYRARWTYPAPLANHLSGWPHHMDTSGMSSACMKRAHDQHHDVIGPVSAQQLRQQSFGSSCPTGTCPTPTRRGLFGWR